MQRPQFDLRVYFLAKSLISGVCKLAVFARLWFLFNKLYQTRCAFFHSKTFHLWVFYWCEFCCGIRCDCRSQKTNKIGNYSVVRTLIVWNESVNVVDHYSLIRNFRLQMSLYSWTQIDQLMWFGKDPVIWSMIRNCLSKVSFYFVGWIKFWYENWMNIIRFIWTSIFNYKSA